MKPNKTHFLGEGGKVLEFSKPHISELDLHDNSARSRVPALKSLFEEAPRLAAAAGARLPALGLRAGPRHQTLKLQRNGGRGGCFPLHYDNPGAPNKRMLTCLLYLNPEWKEGDGGEVRLWPFLRRPRDVAPLLDRLLLFRSDRVLHRVLPARAERYCLTIWLDGTAANAPGDATLRLDLGRLATAAGAAAVAGELRRGPAQRLVSRGVYAEEYAASLAECMAGGDPRGRAALEALHRAHLARQSPALVALVEALRAVRGTLEAEEGQGRGPREEEEEGKYHHNGGVRQEQVTDPSPLSMESKKTVVKKEEEPGKADEGTRGGGGGFS